MLTAKHRQVNRVFCGVLGEIQSGTIGRLSLSPLPSSVLVLGRQVATILESVVIALMLYLAAALVAGVTIPPAPAALVPLAAIVVGSASFSLLVAGLTLLFRRIELLVELLFGLAFIAGGVFLPLERLPDWMAVAGRILFPIAQGIAVTREVLLEGRALSVLPADWGLAWLLAQPVMLPTAGTLFFAASERIAKGRGALGRY